MPKDPITRLTNLLEEERAALLKGDLWKVATFTPEKEALADALEASRPDQLTALAMPLSRNAALLAAARAGVQDVLSTLSKQRAARTALSSYDRSGAPKVIAASQRSTDQRL